MNFGMVTKLNVDKPHFGSTTLLVSVLNARKYCNRPSECSNSGGNGEDENHCTVKHSKVVFETHFVETVATGFRSKSAVFRAQSSHSTSGITSKKFDLRFKKTKFVKVMILSGRVPRQLSEASRQVKVQ